MGKDREQIILFDGVCTLCNGAVNFIIRRDPEQRFKFAALQSEFASERLPTYDLSTDKIDTIILLEDGQAFGHSNAALRIAKQLSGGWSFIYFAIIIPAPIRDFIYKQIANNRYRVFGKNEQCMIPTAEIRQRFIE